MDTKYDRELTGSGKLILFSAVVFVVSLFFDWATAGGWLVSGGLSFLPLIVSKASGLPNSFLPTLIAAIACAALTLPVVPVPPSWLNSGKIPLVMVILAVLGLLPFLLLPYELSTWSPHGQLLFGGWLGFFSALSLLIGTIWSYQGRQ